MANGNSRVCVNKTKADYGELKVGIPVVGRRVGREPLELARAHTKGGRDYACMAKGWEGRHRECIVL